MANIAIYDTNSTPNPITQYLQSVNTPSYSGNVLVNPDLSAVTGQPLKYWKHVAGAIQLMTQGERDAVDAAIQAALVASTRTGAKAAIVGLAANPMVLRAIASIVVDELNDIREWIVSFKAATAAATSLANLQTMVAALPNMADRTLAQVKTAIQNKIDGGTVDN